MCLLRKLVSLGFAQSEIEAYNKAREKSLASAAKFMNKTGRNIFDLSLVYPLQDDSLARRLLPWQEAVGAILGDEARTQGHFYSSANDLHLSLFHHTTRSHLLSETHKQWHRERAVDLFLGGRKEKLFISPEIHFFGGEAAQNAVIIHGYNFTELNQSRVALARYGLRKALEHREHGFEEIRPRLFDRKRGLEIARQIFFDDTVYPDTAHLSLVRFGRAPTVEERWQINELLKDVDFGETVFPELGLYELSNYAIFSNSRRWCNLTFYNRQPQ